MWVEWRMRINSEHYEERAYMKNKLRTFSGQYAQWPRDIGERAYLGLDPNMIYICFISCPRALHQKVETESKNVHPLTQELVQPFAEAGNLLHRKLPFLMVNQPLLLSTQAGSVRSHQAAICPFHLRTNWRYQDWIWDLRHAKHTFYHWTMTSLEKTLIYWSTMYILVQIYVEWGRVLFSFHTLKTTWLQKVSLKESSEMLCSLWSMVLSTRGIKQK